MEKEAMMKQMRILMMIGILFLLIGIILHIIVLAQEFGKFAPLQERYWNINKAERDAAPTGSALAQDLVRIKNFTPKLMTFKLVGIGSILAGIFLMLFGILKALIMMPIRLAGIICPECGKKMQLKK
jgi:hypothetical protein